MKDLMVNRPTEIIPRKTESSREDDIDLRALLGVANDHKWLILIGTALCFLASVFYVIVATPRYQASAMVQVERSTPNVPGQETPLALAEPPRSQASTEIPLLTSRTLLSDAVKTLKLDIQAQPQRFPLIGEFIARRYAPDRPGDVAQPWFGLARYGWGGEQLHIDKLDVPAALQNQPLVLVTGESGRYALLDDEGEPLLRGRAGEPASGRGATMEVKTLRANPGTRFDVTRLNQLAAITALAKQHRGRRAGQGLGDHRRHLRERRPCARGGSARSDQQRLRPRQRAAQLRRGRRAACSSSTNNCPRYALNSRARRMHSTYSRPRCGPSTSTRQTRALLDQVVAINASLQALHTQQPEIARRYTAAHPAHKALQKQIGQLQSEKGALQARMNQLPDIQQGLFRSRATSRSPTAPTPTCSTRRSSSTSRAPARSAMSA